jgi:CRISPR-associated protein Csx10
MNERIVFELTLTSDYHVGSGHRLGTEVDSALLREVDGLPAIRGTTLAALMRDGLRRLLASEPLAAYQQCAASGKNKADGVPRYCGQNEPGQPDCPVCLLFGSPRRPRRWHFSSAWIPGSKKNETPAPAGAAVQPGIAGTPTMRVRVDPRARRAMPDQLFNEEVGDHRLQFRYAVTWRGPGEPEAAEIALLVAAARMVRFIGSSRRRGRGDCFIHLIEPDNESYWLDEFKRLWLDEKPEINNASGKITWPSLPAALPEATGTGYRVRVFARLDEPLLIAAQPEAGNEFSTVSHIAGTVLLGALAGRAARRGDLVKDATAYEKFVSLFLRGQVQFGFLYPAERAPGNILIPSLPAPRDLLTCKNFPFDGRGRITHTVRGYATVEPDDALACPECDSTDTALKPLEGYRCLKEKLPRAKSRQREEMHNEMNPDTHRVSTGDLFGYVALEAGQYFLGDIRCASEEVWRELQELAGLPESRDDLVVLRMGKATRRGYGRVSLAFEENTGHSWTVPPLVERLPDVSQPFTMTLLTDAIITDEWGRFETGFAERWLPEALGLPEGETIGIKRPFVRVREVDSFNNQIGLPRDQDMALVAGSAVGLHYQGALSAEALLEKLASAEAEGIGLRRGEGYGQVAFNHSVYQLPDADGRANVRHSLPSSLRLSDWVEEHPILAEAAFRREWQNKLDKEKWGVAEKPEFTAVARLLLVGSELDIHTLKGQLDSLGQPKHLSLPARGLGKNGLKTEPRENKPFFSADDKGKPGVDLIKKLLDQLSKLTDNLVEGQQRHRAIGVEMIAERAAEAAAKAKEKN